MAAAMGSILATGSMVTMILETIHAMAIMHVHICTLMLVIIVVMGIVHVTEFIRLVLEIVYAMAKRLAKRLTQERLMSILILIIVQARL